MGVSRNRATLDLTVLEDRCCPTASVFAQDHTLYITTDPFSDSVRIREDGQGHVTAFVRDHERAFNTIASDITQIVMHLHGEHDWVEIQSTAPLKNQLDVKVDMGPGAYDKVHFDFASGLGQGSLNVDLRGTLGHSTVDAVVGALHEGTFDLHDHLVYPHNQSHLHLQSLPNQSQRISIG